MSSLIAYGKQSIDDQDVREVVKTLKGDWLTQGPTVKAFEQALCDDTGAKYAVAVANGTAALHLAMLSLGVGPGDEVLTSPLTFAASANCALYTGAAAQFVDVDDRTYHLDVDRLKDFLKVPSRRRRVKAVIPVHLMGTVCDIEAIHNICAKYGIKIVEDAAHALGAKYQSRGQWWTMGSCRHSDMAIFSFHPIKHITTGEGGAVLTNNKKIYQTLLRLRHHGIVRDSRRPWMYDIRQVGYNYRLTDFQCALGVSQLQKLDGMVKKRRQSVARYNEAFAGIAELRTPFEREGTYASYHLYVIRVPASRRNRLYADLRRQQILTQVNYLPVHLFSIYRARGFRPKDFPVAEQYSREALSLPLYADLSSSDQARVIEAVEGFFRHGRKSVK